MSDEFGKLAFNVASAIAFPRKTGSAGEREARERVKGAFGAAGLLVKEEFFNCSDYGIRVAARWAMVPTGACLLAAALLLHFSDPIAAAVLAVISVFPAGYISSRSRTGFAGPRQLIQYLTANVTGAMAEEPKAGLTVVLMAHYDSKSQVFPIWWRVALFILSAGLSLVLIILIVAAAALWFFGAGALYLPVILPAALVLFLLDLSFLLNTAGNLSDGALDNATGVGLITEIAQRLVADPPAGLKLRVVATAAEEIGLCGSVAYLEAHRRDLDPDRTVVLNFDGCGGHRVASALKSYGLFPRRTPEHLVTLVEQIAFENSIPFRWHYIPVGMATDLMPFHRAGYQGVDFLGLAGKSHSTQDRMNLVREPALSDYVRLGVELVKRLAESRQT